ncbi:Hypothetical predicted protein [Octopus vulgaris]|uniref:Uncharacterized protein n=1 Tax=Octopus vulgaris TaxID=6645 RepID=A0AA36BGH9_OCTVU|nr:Hypothetical predicted protein [Octopus vulgaris]
MLALTEFDIITQGRKKLGRKTGRISTNPDWITKLWVELDWVINLNMEVELTNRFGWIEVLSVPRCD